MKNIKDYYNFLVESYGENKFFLLFGDLVYIDSIRNWGDEIRVEYTKKDGSKDSYTADYKDFSEDFVETNDSFEIIRYRTSKEVPASPINEVPKKDNKCNLVYYVGDVKKETIKTNIDSKLAYALKANYSKLPQYKLGKIKVEKI
jgi:hypothetical protein